MAEPPSTPALTPELWRKTEEILLAVWDTPPGSRDLLLEQRCAGDPALLAGIRALLAADAAARAWKSPPPKQPSIDSARRAGPFELERLIGRGGMGAVYLAHRADGQFEQKVAVKLIGVPFEIESFRERFRRERQILATLDHPCITRLLDGGVTDAGDLFLAMEYVDGAPLDRYCREAGRSIPDRLRLFRQVCAAVHYAHQNLVIHRDIKPSNILVMADGTPKLLDFGTAKLMADADTTATGLGLMSVSYASPEQLRGEPVSTLTDVFSLGAVLFEILTGVRFFIGDLAARISSVAPPPLPKTLAGELRQIVSKAVAFEPAQRYPSVEQLSEDIRRYLDGEPVLAHPPGLLYRSRKFVRRHPWNVALTALFVIGMTAAVIFSMRQATLAKRQAARAQHITAFLTDFFGSPNPSWLNKLKTRGKNVTIVEALGELRNRLGKDLAEDPDVEVELRRTIGLMYTGVGDHNAAREQLALALAKQLTNRNADPLVTANLYVARAAENNLTLRFREGLADGRRALSLVARPRTKPDKDVKMQAYNAVAIATYGLGKVDETEQPALEALRLSREVYGNEGPTPIALGLLATLYMSEARLEEAERAAREAWSIYQSRGGNLPAEAFSPLLGLASLCMEREDYSCAKEYLDRAAAIVATGFGPGSVYGISVQGQQGLLLGLTGHLKEGRRELDASRGSWVKLTGPESAYVAQNDAAYGRIEFAAGNLAAAETYFRKAYAGFQKYFPKGDVRTTTVASRLGECLAAEGKRDEGERLLRESYQALLAKLGPGHAYTQKAAARLAGAGKIH